MVEAVAGVALQGDVADVLRHGGPVDAELVDLGVGVHATLDVHVLLQVTHHHGLVAHELGFVCRREG